MKLIQALCIFALCLSSFAMEKPYLGVGLEEFNSKYHALVDEDVKGVLITHVTISGPAREAGMRMHDIVTAINETVVTTPNDLIKALNNFEPEDEIIVKVRREGQDLDLKVKLGEKQNTRIARRLIEVMESKSNFIGVQSETLKGQLAEYFNVEKGVLIKHVEEDSPAEAAGIKAGDIITTWNDEPVVSSRDLSKKVRASKKDTAANISVLRHGESLDLAVTPEEREHHGNGFNFRFSPDDLHTGNDFHFENDFRFPKVRRLEGLDHDKHFNEIAPKVWTLREDSKLQDRVKELEEQIAELKKALESLQKK